MTIPSLLLVLVVGEGFIIVLTAMFLLSCWCAGTPSPDGQPAPPAEAAPLPPAREPRTHCASSASLATERPTCSPETRIASCMTITTQETHVLAALQSLQRVMVQLAPTEADRATERQLQVTFTEVLLVVTALVRHVQHQEAERLVKELTLEASIQRLVSRQLARQQVQRRTRRQASHATAWSGEGVSTIPETPLPEVPSHTPRTVVTHEAILVS